MPKPRLFRQMFLDIFRSPKPSKHRPDPARWLDQKITGACLGHSTVLLNFVGSHVLTDPVFSNRVGLRLGPIVIGPKRHLFPALSIRELPKLDLILLSHAHFDHLDLASLHRFSKDTPVVTAAATVDLLRHFKNVHELAWGQQVEVAGMSISAFEVNHWGARMLKDDYRGYNGYVVEKAGRRVCYAGDTANTDAFAALGNSGKSIDLMIMPIGAYDPWIRAHCNPEEAYAMSEAADAKYFVPVHHQTFKLSAEPMEEPGMRIRKAFAAKPECLLAVDVGETFVVPLS